tara:strand:+ start:11855 stop:12142 length:288 start_codon:yes stop_codon:yes gene_type:complete
MSFSINLINPEFCCSSSLIEIKLVVESESSSKILWSVTKSLFAYSRSICTVRDLSINEITVIKYKIATGIDTKTKEYLKIFKYTTISENIKNCSK